jgi:hypothetical protein
MPNYKLKHLSHIGVKFVTELLVLMVFTCLQNVLVLKVYYNTVMIYFELWTVAKAHCIIILFAAPFHGTLRPVGTATHSLDSHAEPEAPVQNIAYSVEFAQC